MGDRLAPTKRLDPQEEGKGRRGTYGAPSKSDSMGAWFRLPLPAPTRYYPAKAGPAGLPRRSERSLLNV